MILGDPKVAMQFDRYEKLIVVARGVELVNWPDSIPFLNASKIGSIHSLHCLHNALTHENQDQHCRWVTLSEEDWEKHKKAHYDAEDRVVPCTCKCKACVADDDESSTSNQLDAEAAWPSKRSAKATGSGKENDGLSASAGKKGRHGRKGTAGDCGKVKVKERVREKD